MKDKDLQLQHLAAIVRDSDDAIISKTLEGIITSWNRGAERIYGYTAQEAIGRTVAMLVPPDREDELPEILQKLTQGERLNNYDTLRVTKDGRLLNISLTISPIRDATGAITGASSIGRDVTKEKEAEAALRESARAYKLLMDQASEAILISYPDQPLIEVNQRAIDMLGYTREELIQLSAAGSLLPAGLSDLQLRQDEMLDGDIVCAERSVLRKDGQVMIIEISTRRLDDGRIVTTARDITDRKRAEVALSQNEKRLAEAQKQAHLGNWEWDLVSDKATGSAEFLRLLGLQTQGSESSFTLQSFIECFQPEDRESMQQILAKTVEEQGPLNFEKRIVRPDGTVRILHALGEVILDEAGKPVRMIGTAQDITESRQAEEALRESEARLRSAIDLAELWFYDWNPRTDELIWDTRLKEIWGLPPDASVDNEIFLAGIHPDDREAVQAEITRSGNPAGNGLFFSEYRVISQQDKQERWIASRGRTFFEGDVAVRHFGVAQDITESKRASEALRDSEAKYRTLVEDAADGIFTATQTDDQRLTVEDVNSAACEMFGYTREELVGRNVTELIVAEDRLLALSKNAALSDGKVLTSERLLIRKDGTTLAVETTTKMLDDGRIQSIARDITKRKDAEESLQLSSEILQRVKSLVLVSDKTGQITYISPSAKTLLGYEPDELLGDGWWEASRLDPDEPQRERVRILNVGGSSTALSPASGEPYERLVKDKDGELHWILWQDAKGPDGQVIGVGHDITERKQSEEAVVRSELELRALFAAMTDVVMVLDAEGRYLQIAPTSPDLLYKPPTELLGQTVHEVLPKDDADNILHCIRQALENQQPVHVEYSLPIDDSYVWFDGTVSPMGEEKVFWIARDVTERKHAEQELRNSEERYRVVTETARDVTITIDEESNILFVNLAIQKTFGYSVAEVIGQPLNILMPQPQRDRHRAGMEEYIRTGHKRVDWSSVEVQGLHKSGREIPLEISFVESFAHGQRVFISTMQDITERKQVEAAHNAMEAAKAANQAKSEFLSRMSHELRTPLNAILGFGQLLQMDVITPEQKESVDYILKGGQHLLNLINEVLDISRIDAGKLAVSMEPVLVRDVLQESLDLVQPLAAHRNIEVNADLAWMDNCYVMADPQRLEQVSLNLLSNAIKYNRGGGVVNVSCSELSCEADGQNLQARVRIAVQDTGPGISPDNVARLFTPFERLGAEQGEVEGTGLGLALSKHLVEAMGGAIGVESAQGVGSTFWVELVTTQRPSQYLHYLATGPLGMLSHSKAARTVLYVEDNISNFRLVDTILKHRPNVTLLPAIQGDIGLTMAEVHHPDLILLDLNLPDMPGDTVLARLKGNPSTAGIPVVVVSADATPPQVERLMAAGASDYITKPINVIRFLTVLDESLKHEQDLIAPC